MRASLCFPYVDDQPYHHPPQQKKFLAMWSCPTFFCVGNVNTDFLYKHCLKIGFKLEFHQPTFQVMVAFFSSWEAHLQLVIVYMTIIDCSPSLGRW